MKVANIWRNYHSVEMVAKYKLATSHNAKAFKKQTERRPQSAMTLR